jgi:hypothetical protein
MVKANIGTGMLGLPAAVMNAGVVVCRSAIIFLHNKFQKLFHDTVSIKLCIP